MIVRLVFLAAAALALGALVEPSSTGHAEAQTEIGATGGNFYLSAR